MRAGLLLLLFFHLTNFVFTQEISVIDNKGNILLTTSNNVNTSNTAPNSPVEGDIWFGNSDTSNIISKVYNGSSWDELVSGNLFWKIDGNSGIDTTINFLGTTDDTDLIFRTNNLNRLRLKNDNPILLFSNPGDFSNSIISSSAVLGINGNNHSRLRLTAGDSDTRNDSKGASIDLHGNTSGINSGVLDLVAGSAANDTNNAIKFWTNTNGSTQQTSVVVNGNGNIGINTNSPTQKLDVRGSVRIDEWIYDENNEKGTSGQILSSTATGLDWVDAGSANADNLGNHTATENINLSNNWISNDGNDEGIRIDNNGNVGIGTSTPTEELQVDGTIDAKAYKTDILTARRTTNFTTWNGNQFRDFANLTHTFTLTEEATVMVNYNISMAGSGSHLVTRLLVGSNVRSRNISGNVTYWHITTTWYETLAAGTHTIKVQYRTPATRTLVPSADWNDAYLQVMILGNQ
jgi:hypothetical protein